MNLLIFASVIAILSLIIFYEWFFGEKIPKGNNKGFPLTRRKYK